jgi:NDP-sugar pyrophosphorylase family protein
MVLAAGLGTRLRPVTENIPKPLVPVLNLPLILHNLLFLKEHGVDEVMINLHYLPDMIPAYLGDGSDWGLHLHYSRESRILGTAGGIGKVRDFLEVETFVVMNADILIQLDLKEAISRHQKNNALSTMVVSDREDSTRYGVVGVDEENRIRRITDRVGSDRDDLRRTVFLGLHILEPEIFQYFPSKTPSCINADVYPALILSGKNIYGYLQHGSYWNDLGTPCDYFQAHWDILDGKFGKTPPSSPLIDPEASVIEPVWIGSGVSIDSSATVGPYSVIGDRVRVGKNCRISKSVLWEEVQVPENTEIISSIVAGVTTTGGYSEKFLAREGVYDLPLFKPSSF